MNKYGAKKIKDPATGFVFDSKAEFIRWCELRILERAGRITDLKRQVKYLLIPPQRDERGKLIERETSYIADFEYLENGKKVVEDTKGVRTDAYKIKRKLMLHKYGIRIKET